MRRLYTTDPTTLKSFTSESGGANSKLSALRAPVLTLSSGIRGTRSANDGRRGSLADLRRKALTEMVMTLRDSDEHRLAFRLDWCRRPPHSFKCNMPWLCDRCWISDTFRAQVQLLGRAYSVLLRNPDTIFAHASLGVGSCRNWEDGDALISKTLSRLSKKRSNVWSLVAGGAWVKEIEYRERGGYAPHLHMLLAFDPAHAPRWWKSPRNTWARTARAVAKPDVPFDPSSLDDRLYAELRRTGEVRLLDVYDCPATLDLPAQGADLSDVLAALWDIIGYGRKSELVARSGPSQKTRRLAPRARLALHKARLRRRGLFGVFRCPGAKGMDFTELGTLLARALTLGPFAHLHAPAESGCSKTSPVPSTAILELLRDAMQSPNASLRDIASRVLDVPDHLPRPRKRVRIEPRSRPGAERLRDRVRRRIMDERSTSSGPHSKDVLRRRREATEEHEERARVPYQTRRLREVER